MDRCDSRCIHTKSVQKTKTELPDLPDIVQMAEIFKAISDPTRLKIVLSLLNREHCVCDIAAICSQSDSAVSHQLRLLRTLKILKNRREGKIIYYSIDDEHVKSLILMSLEHVRH